MGSRVRVNPRDARSVALHALRLCRAERVFVQEALNRIAGDRAVPSTALSFATELGLGVTRHRLTLGHLLSHFLHGKWSNFKPALRDVLLLGAYQVVFLRQVPDSSAVSRTVDLAKAVGGRRAGALTNAVLRTILRHRKSTESSRQPASPTHRIEIGADQFAIFDLPILPDPEADPVEYLALATSHPQWLVRRWIGAHGVQRTEQICAYGARRPETFLRPNRTRITAQKLCERLRAENANVALDADREMVHWEDGPPLTGTQAFQDGLFQPQDPTAKRVADFIRPKPGQVILDICAAPGTKCTHLAELMENRGTLVAADRTEQKLALIEANARRLGLSIIRTCLASDLVSRLGDQLKPEIILIDAPCSNTGVLARRPEARYRLRPEQLAKLALQQQKLLDHAVALAGPETRIIYSTCSIETEENESVIEAFVRRHPEYRLRNSRISLPHASKDPMRWHDGGFVAELARGKTGS